MLDAAVESDALARESHYVPRSYMRRWSAANDHVWAYRTLVPRATCREWEATPTARIAKQRDLYTSVATGRESDRIERWLNREVEIPFLGVREKLVGGAALTGQDRRRLARYLAALDRRGPVEYSESTERLAGVLPGVLEGVLERVVRVAERAARAGKSLPVQPPTPGPSLPGLRVAVEEAPTDDDPDRGALTITMPVGRELWLEQIERIVNETSRVLEEHEWRVIAPHSGWRWFTSDHPVLRLNFESYDRYDFGGGWSRPGSEILLPLTPHHLLFTHIGRTRQPRSFSLEQTVLVQRLIAERAHRWIIADGCPRRVAWFRPRVVNREAYLTELQAWRTWHEQQSAAHDTGGRPDHDPPISTTC